MTRHDWGVVSAVTTAVIGWATPAVAQHGHGPGHYDYHPGRYDRHHGHYDYHPGHYDYHGPAYSRPRPIYVPPRTGYLIPVQPGYVAPPTGYFGGEDHPHDHASSPQPAQIAYGGFAHIDDLAAALEAQANDLCLELHYNYQHNPGFREAYRDAYGILTTAKFIHGSEHAGDRERLRAAVGELDGLFHHVQTGVAGWTGHHHRRVGQGGLAAKLEDLQETLHHLMDDVGARPGPKAHAPSDQGLPEDLPQSAPFGTDAPFQGVPSYRGNAPELGGTRSLGVPSDRQVGPYVPQGDSAPSDSSIGPPPDDELLVVPN